jgi:hypothetical protein
MTSVSEVSVQLLHTCQFTVDSITLGNTRPIVSVRETQSVYSYFSESRSLCGCKEFHFKKSSLSLFRRRERKLSSRNETKNYWIILLRRAYISREKTQKQTM